MKLGGDVRIPTSTRSYPIHNLLMIRRYSKDGMVLRRGWTKTRTLHGDSTVFVARLRASTRRHSCLESWSSRMAAFQRQT